MRVEYCPFYIWYEDEKKTYKCYFINFDVYGMLCRGSKDS